MKAPLVLGLAVAALTFPGCEKDEIEPRFPNPVNLADLEVGQRSGFVRYTGSCLQGESTLSLQPDTLIWEVVAAEGGTFTLREAFTAGSKICLRVSCCRRSTIARGVPARTARPFHDVAS